ncbi:LuxR C-terminal-related transcriptional regulator [Streptomyces cinereoruber]|uniref:LuxR C-terminal-related transcriptional regulator n=1 Tax=Streptomyces cinereoruber TaxID=67260 RepID=UPI003633CA75
MSALTKNETSGVALAPRERQVLEGLADGRTLPEVANSLRLRDGTATGYLKLAKRRLGASENPAALAHAYANGSITRPEQRDPEDLFLPVEQRELIPLIAQGLRATQIAARTKRPVAVVRRDARELMAALGAKNPAHVVTQAWAYQLLTEEQVRSWMTPPEEDQGS